MATTASSFSRVADGIEIDASVKQVVAEHVEAAMKLAKECGAQTSLTHLGFARRRVAVLVSLGGPPRGRWGVNYRQRDPN